MSSTGSASGAGGGGAPRQEEPLEPFADAAALLLGEQPHLTGEQTAEQAGIPREVAESMWRALGLPNRGDEVAFTHGDLAALTAVRQLATTGIADQHRQLQLARVLGRAMAALAEAQVAVVAEAAGRGVQVDATALLRTMEDLQAYVWRRHMYAAISRLSAAPADSTSVAVGFTDLVGYTALSRDLSETDLADLLDRLDERAQAAMVDLGGRIIKTVGDEIMWLAGDPRTAAAIALALADRDVRTGVAWGPTLARFGDHYGSTVNVAARLTGVARPGTVLVDRELARALADDADLEVRHLRPIPVRGYDHLLASVLRGRPAR